VAYREFPEDIPCSNRREGKIITLKITEMTRNTMTVTVMGTALDRQKVFNEMLVGEQEMK
jgi:hypothetical protein